jgi:hypothetical protein
MTTTSTGEAAVLQDAFFWIDVVANAIEIIMLALILWQAYRLWKVMYSVLRVLRRMSIRDKRSEII